MDVRDGTREMDGVVGWGHTHECGGAMVNARWIRRLLVDWLIHRETEKESREVGSSE